MDPGGEVPADAVRAAFLSLQFARRTLVGQRLVVGIFPESDPKKIEVALTGQTGIDMGRLRVVTREAQSAAHDESTISFVHVREAQNSNDFSDDMTHGQGMMTDSGGTSVPGTGSRGPSLGSLTRHGGGVNYLAGVKIPGDQIDNFNDAIRAGRVVVLYDANDDDAAALAGFNAAGLRNVKAF
uniref:Uncharacterized protein n=1 Tax=mine drainage metagenome TaxID=410659 RepID=E6Q5Y8_9ZZZZ